MRKVQSKFIFQLARIIAVYVTAVFAAVLTFIFKCHSSLKTTQFSNLEVNISNDN